MIAAFFDIDGTLYREGMITATFKKLIKSDIISNEVWYKELRDRYIKWDKRQGNYDDYLIRMAEIYTEAIVGLHRTQIEFIARKVIEQSGDRVYTFTRDRILWHKEKGHKVITISGSPFELVREISEKYDFDEYVGTIYEVGEDHRYNGKVQPMWDSDNKKKTVNKLVAKYDIDLANSYAYGDTAGDYRMLKSVGNPYAINPTKELIEQIAEDPTIREKAKIIVERKDMIYHLTAECIDTCDKC